MSSQIAWFFKTQVCSYHFANYELLSSTKLHRIESEKQVFVCHAHIDMVAEPVTIILVHVSEILKLWY